jgi:hypothetical protein
MSIKINHKIYLFCSLNDIINSKRTCLLDEILSSKYKIIMYIFNRKNRTIDITNYHKFSTVSDRKWSFFAKYSLRRISAYLQHRLQKSSIKCLLKSAVLSFTGRNACRQYINILSKKMCSTNITSGHCLHMNMTVSLFILEKI